MKKAVIIIITIVLLLGFGVAAAAYIDPSLAGEISALLAEPTEPATEETAVSETEPPQKITTITLSGKKELNKGDSSELSVKYSPESAPVPILNWSSSNKNVAVVDDSGKVNAVAKGECEITAQVENSNAKAVFKIEVKDKELEKINILNNYLIKIPDSRLESYGTKSTTLLTLERAEIGDFNNDKSNELLIQMKSASGFSFSYIVALNSANGIYEIKNFSSYSNVFESTYDNYRESFFSDGGDNLVIKTTAVSNDNDKKTKIRNVTLTYYSSGGTTSTTSFKDVYKYKDADMKKLDKGEFTIDGQAYEEPNYLSRLSAALDGYREINGELNSRVEALTMGKFVKVETVCKLDKVYEKQIEWKCDKPEIAKINENGVVTGVRSGSCIATGVLKGLDSAVARVVINVRESSKTLSDYLSREKGKAITGANGRSLSYKGSMTADVDGDGTKELLLYYKSGGSVQVDVCEDNNGEVERISAAFSDTVSSGDVEMQVFVNNAGDEIVLSENNETGGKTLIFEFFEYKNGKFESCSSEYKIVSGTKNSYYQDGNNITQAEFERQTGHYSKYMDFKEN